MSNESPRILIVDDDLTCREILKAHLHKKYDCLSVSSGDEAINTFIKSFREPAQKKIDIILLDFEMPGDTGINVILKLKKEENKRNISSEEKVKIIMTTSHNDRDIVMACKAAGADQYLLKPVELDPLMKKIQQLLPPLTEEPQGPTPSDVPDF